MQAYETSATVQGQGEVHVAGVPFAAGTEVEVMISPRRGCAVRLSPFGSATDVDCTESRGRDLRTSVQKQNAESPR